jgi:two-component system phosphate regulon sensor histidine kinase PhoR
MLWRLFATLLIVQVSTICIFSAFLAAWREPWQIFTAACAATAVAATASLPLAYWLARRIALPIEELTRGVKRIAAGDLDQKVYVDTPGGISELAQTFNYMSDQLVGRVAELEEDRQQLRTILSGMVEGVVALDADERILFANERATQLLGLNGQQSVGRRLWETVRQTTLQDVVRRALQGQGPCRGEFTATPDPGTAFPAGSTGKTLTIHAAGLPGYPPRGAVLVLHDTTELRRLERVRQEFVANVSHELKTPLSVITACVETLLDGAADDPVPRANFLQQISTQADRLHALILDLLSLARIESGTEVFEFQTVHLEPLVTECLERHRARAESKSQALTGVAPEAASQVGLSAAGDVESVSAWGDEEAVRQIVENLVDNALKYTPAGGRIWVRWRTEDDEVVIEVEDTGIGIPEQDLPRIFERFYRADKARSRELGGTGLGLSIVKHLVQAMHGTVRATSRLGLGTMFHVRLPRSPEA